MINSSIFLLARIQDKLLVGQSQQRHNETIWNIILCLNTKKYNHSHNATIYHGVRTDTHAVYFTDNIPRDARGISDRPTNQQNDNEYGDGGRRDEKVL